MKFNKMKNILLPTDFSGNSKNAIQYALKFFEGENCTFHILNSQKPTGYITADVLYGAPGTSIYEGILNDNKKALENMVQFCESNSEEENFTFIPKLDFDNIADAINQAVALNNIELIVMGSNGATGAAEVLFGSNTLKVIRNVDCPVLIVPEDYTFENIEAVLLSLNYQNEVSKESVSLITEIVKKNGASLKILEIEEEDIQLAAQTNQAERSFKGLNLEQYSIKNIPASVAINAFEQLIPVQLHAMIVERKSFLDRFIFGSETSKISYGSPIPLLVLHH
ncbi:MAG: universal stress protein, UspA family [Aequorivita sp.]|nr:universal stress protein, UspA family [Aequorivita sp.]MBF30841.1 universal stress protein, UspA family [Aequorivita sp.]|tara:strand:+ start:56238 stop:57080 length:843 start_codon:yes stop_codon:yes gene_type:complete